MKELLKNGAIMIFVALVGGGAANAQSTSWACKNELIRGVYGFTIEGAKLGGPGPVGPQVGVAITEFDGAGNLTQLDAVTIDGVEVSDFTHPVATGTYTVNNNCTGTFTINFTDGRPTVTTYFVVVENGTEIDTVVEGVPAGGSPGILATRSIGKRRSTSSIPFIDRED